MDIEEQNLNALLEDTNLEEVLPEPIRVSLIEFQEYETTVNDRVVIRRRPVARVAEINTYVPMKILHRMMASQEKIKQIQAMSAKSLAKGETTQDKGQQAMIDWMVGQVLDVWKLTEPEMTAEALMEGLSFQKVFNLFKIFFGDLLKSMNNTRK